MLKEKLHEFGPGEVSVQQNDLVSLENYQIRWRVKRVHEANMYLRSEIGNRFAVAPISKVTGVWRNPHFIPEPSWGHLYNIEEAS
jgi:hypothetical protein